MFWGTTHHKVCVLCLVRPPLVTQLRKLMMGGVGGGGWVCMRSKLMGDVYVLGYNTP